MLFRLHTSFSARTLQWNACLNLSVLLFCSDLTQRSLVIFPIIKGLIKNRSVMGLHLLPYPDTAAHSSALMRPHPKHVKPPSPHTGPDTSPSLWPPSPLSRYNYAWNSRVLSILNISSSYTNLALTPSLASSKLKLEI